MMGREIDKSFHVANDKLPRSQKKSDWRAYGLAKNSTRDRRAWKKAETITPVRRMDIVWDSERPEIRRTARTAIKEKIKAAIWAGKFLPRKTRDRAAPKAAPNEIPRINSLTSGFLNKAWREAPERERAAPAMRARRSLGSRIRKRISW